MVSPRTQNLGLSYQGLNLFLMIASPVSLSTYSSSWFLHLYNKEDKKILL